MDLIYTNENNVEMGILQSYDLDLAFGSTENDFELKLALDQNVLVENSQFFFEGTEYGGIVDAIAIDTESNEITYKGRTWHGVLAGKIVVPPAGTRESLFSGEPNAIIKKLITICDLDDMFEVLADSTNKYIDNVSFEYPNLYDCIKELLATINYRLKMYRIGRKVCLEAVPLINYANSEEWDAASKSFKAEHKNAKVNHLICLGNYDEEDNQRTIIDLYADSEGTVQAYATEDIPYDSSQYILSNTNQKLFGKNEITEVLDAESSATYNNYMLLEDCPEDFGTEFSKYFKFDTDKEKYVNLEARVADELKLLTSAPKRWSTQYGNYYTSDGEPVAGVVVEVSYKRLKKTATPSVPDWEQNYGNYYYLKTDGHTEPVWTQVQGVDVRKYMVQTIMPSSWSTNWGSSLIWWFKMENVKKDKYKDSKGNEKTKTPSFESGKYYKRTDAGNYVLLTAKPSDWENSCTSYYTPSGSEYVRTDTRYSKRPKWKAGKFYDYIVVDKKAPEWDQLVQYGIQIPSSVVAPTFATGTYYKMVTRIYKPVWTDNTYYELHLDKYADLVARGIKQLEKYKNNDSIDMTLPVDGYEYFIGDIVGASDDAHNFRVQQQPITKKILKIDSSGMELSYEIGGK